MLCILLLGYASLPLLLCGLLVSVAYGQERPIMHTVTLAPTEQEVVLYSTLNGAFQGEIREAIESGIPMTITFYMKLYRKRGPWFDEEILSKTIQHVVKYDVLKDEYRVSEINGLFSNIKVTKHQPTMERWMSEIEGQPLIPFHLLQRGEAYYVKVMADLQAVKSPFPLSHIPFLASFWDAGTSWTASRPFTMDTPPQR
jgi:hypothetical protein